METIINFRGTNGEHNIYGFMLLEEADDEKPLRFYNPQGLSNGANYPPNPHTKDDTKYFQLREAMAQDDMLIQYVVDYAEDSVVVSRPRYTLFINEGNES